MIRSRRVPIISALLLSNGAAVACGRSADPVPRSAGSFVRYQIVSSEGQIEERLLPDTLSPTDAAAHLCRQHSVARPRGIRFVVLHQLTITREQYLHGVRPADPEALRRETLEEVPCGD